LSEDIPNPSLLESPEVQNVFQIAEELVRDNKVIQTNLLFKIAKRKLKYTSEKLFSIINLLFQNKILVEGSRFTRTSILYNEYRTQIYEFIRKYPGAHFSIIKENIFGKENNPKGSTGQFVWHLEALIKFNYLKKLEVKKYSIFLPVEMDKDLGIFFFWLRDRINYKIGNILKNNEPLDHSKLIEETQESKGTIYYHIKTMLEYDILSSDKNEKTGKIEVWLNSEKRDLIIQILKNIKESPI